VICRLYKVGAGGADAVLAVEVIESPSFSLFEESRRIKRG
jgi:hypothetical protein